MTCGAYEGPSEEAIGESADAIRRSLARAGRAAAADEAELQELHEDIKRLGDRLQVYAERRRRRAAGEPPPAGSA